MSSIFSRAAWRAGVAVFAAACSITCAAEDQQVAADDTQPRSEIAAADTPASSTPVSSSTTDSSTSVKAAAAQMPGTRFVIGLDRKVEYQIFALANPNRVVVEFPDVKLQLPDMTDGNTVGLVKSFRGGLAAPGKTRVVIDVTQPVVVDSSKIEKTADGHVRLALDILPADAALRRNKKGLKQPPLGLGAAGLQPPLPKPAQSPRTRAARAFKPVIVLDPGHGGMDSGASKYGTVEKNVVLAFSHVLRELLEETGRYKVLMTRDKDIFVELDERLAYGERNSANLFIAIHADYAGKRARGATIFSLRDRVAKDLKRSATNRSAEKVLSANELNTVRRTEGDPSAVTGILADLAERDIERTQERSDVFAKTVIENMSESTTMRQEPDQQAAFRVLKTAQFPSVLIELAYVSNQQDANNLKSDEWREKVADSIVSAIDNYFGNQIAHMPM